MYKERDMSRVIRKIQPKVQAILPRKRVAAYARVSSDKETMLESLAAQISYYGAYIQRNPEWLYVGVYADEGLTGTKDKRPEFQRLIADCYAGLIDMVITKSLSRFSRNTLDTLNILRELKQRGVDVFFERENIHSNSGDGELMLSILSSFAQEESRSVSENCKWRIRKKMEQGELVNLREMFGYTITKGRVEIDQERATIVRSIFFDYLDGVGTAELARRLTEAGVPTLRGGQWTAGKILGMLKNEKYIGDALSQKKYVLDHLSKRAVWNHGQRPMYYAEETHPAIIEKFVFEQVQLRIAEELKIVGGHRPNNLRYPFSGRIMCDNCRKHFKRITKRGMAYWHCSTTVQFGTSACYSKRIPEATLLDITAQATGMSEFSEDVFETLIDHIRAADGNSLIYIFKDERTVQTIWQDRSRADSWTDEMKQAAREKSLLMKETNGVGSNSEAGTKN